MKISRGIIERFWRQKQGHAMMELALSLPLLMVLIFGVIEVARYVQAHQKVTFAAFSTADLITQYSTLRDEDVAMLLRSAQVMISPFEANDQNMNVVVTSIVRPEGGASVVQWQRSWPAGAAGLSRISSGEGSEARIPNFDFLERDQVVAVEIFYNYRSMLGLSFTDPFVPEVEGFYKYAFTRPRYGSLMQPAS